MFCINVPFQVKTGEATAEGDPEPDDLATIEIIGANENQFLSTCPEEDDVEVFTFDTENSSGPQDSDFYLELNG